MNPERRRSAAKSKDLARESAKRGLRVSLRQEQSNSNVSTFHSPRQAICDEVDPKMGPKYAIGWRNENHRSQNPARVLEKAGLRRFGTALEVMVSRSKQGGLGEPCGD
jgi:hypothetical protein